MHRINARKIIIVAKLDILFVSFTKDLIFILNYFFHSVAAASLQRRKLHNKTQLPFQVNLLGLKQQDYKSYFLIACDCKLHATRESARNICIKDLPCRRERKKITPEKYLNVKTLRVLLFFLLTIICVECEAQSLAPPKIWDKRFGGIDYEAPSVFCPLADGTFLAGGYSSSGISGDKTQASQGSYDYWVVKIDAAGNKIWDKRFGGTNLDYLTDILELSNGKILLLGYSDSNISGDKTQNSFGSYDYWIVEIDQSGNKIWDKQFGGGGSDEAFQAVETPDNKIVIIGLSYSSPGGNKTAPYYGSSDAWLIKIDTLGNLLSQFTIGGTSSEGSYDGLGIDISDDGFIYCSFQTGSSISGNITSNSFGGYDYLVCKLDLSLNIIWQKRFGGTSYDYSPHIGCVKSKIAVCGYSESGISGNKTVANHNNSRDYWSVILDSNGNCVSQRAYGGTATDDSQQQVFITNENNILAAGTSYSPISGDKTQTNMNSEQSWVILFDTLNNLIWDRTVIDNSHDEIGYCCQLANGSYILGNNSSGSIGGDKTQNSWGGYDYFMICLAAPQAAIANFSAPQNVCEGTCINFSFTGILYPAGTLQWSFPGGNPATDTSHTPNVCYSTPGDYDVQVIATNALGTDTFFIANYIHVLPTINPVLSYAGGILTCNAGAQGATFQWYWNNGILNGAVDSTYAPVYNGTYKVIVNAGTPCPDTLTWFVSNLPPIIQSIFTNITTLCSGTCRYFTASAYNTPATYQWIFQGGTPATSIATSPNVCYTSPGDYDVTLIMVNAYGSDTIFYNNYVHVLNTTFVLNANICAGDTFNLNGNLLTASGTYNIDTLTSFMGCDSFLNLQLTVVNAGTSNSSAGICAGDTFNFYGASLTTAGNYSHIISTGMGCDSFINLQLTVLNATSHSQIQKLCDGDSIFLQSAWQTTAGTYHDTLVNAQGCDSILAVTLFVDALGDSVIVHGDTLAAQQNGLAYQWYNCDSSANIPGATSQSYVPTQTGNYAVWLSDQQGCYKLSACNLITIINGINDLLRSNISIFPNPTTGELNIAGNSIIDKVEIINLLGEIIYSSTPNKKSFSIHIDFDGMYFIAMKTSNQIVTRKLIVQKR